MLVRLQKFLAEAGIGSRRHCETLIQAGRVAVNGAPVTRLGSKIDGATDRVAVDGQPVKAEPKVYIVINKPGGTLCTSQDTEGRPRVLDLLPASLPRLFTVGRLDTGTEGLLFLTNDGTFGLRLAHPRYKMPKTYLVEVEGAVTPTAITRLLQGIESDGETLRALDVRRLPSGKLQIVLGEGRNRQVRRMMTAIGHPVRRLVRIAVGDFELGKLKPGQWRNLTNEEVRKLMRM